MGFDVHGTHRRTYWGVGDATPHVLAPFGNSAILSYHSVNSAIILYQMVFFTV